DDGRPADEGPMPAATTVRRGLARAWLDECAGLRATEPAHMRWHATQTLAAEMGEAIVNLRPEAPKPDQREALSRILRAIAANRRVLFVVERADRADRESLALVVEGMRHAPIRLIALGED